MSDTAAIYYHPDAFKIDRADLKGRHSAGAGFLTAVSRHHQRESLYCYAANHQLASDFAETVGQLAGRSRRVRWIPLANPAGLREAGCVFLPGPSLTEHAWQRRFSGQRGYSICGVTHTICTDRVMDAFGQLLLAPLQEWDALIVTSHPARKAILNVFDMWGDYLGERLGSAPTPSFQLPVIPLGVDCMNFAPTVLGRESGQALRQEHGVGASDVVLLFFGRLSFHAKAHPAAMFAACESAQRRTQRRIHLFVTGSFPNPSVSQAFRDAARRLCPSVNVVFLDGNDPAIASASWRAADLFISLSDNIQETFGLTPVEAMAAGLPAIVSDWDGYRDTVVDGETGFLIPTTVPGPGAGRDLALRYLAGADTTDRYMGAASQATAVDIQASADAVLRLVDDDELRRKMAEAASRRALSVYDWSVVMRSYEELWTELARLRSSASEIAPVHNASEPYPLRADPFVAFAGFATRQVAPDWRIRRVAQDVRSSINTIADDPMCNFTAQVLLTAEECAKMAEVIQAAECSVEHMAGLFPHRDAGIVQRTLMWLMKYGVIVIEKP